VSDHLFAVTGATGKVGGRVAAGLARKGERQRLIVRDAARAPDIPGAEIRVASGYAAGGEMRAALEGADTLLLVPGRESPVRVDEHISAINAAVAAGMQRIVYLSFVGAAPDSVFTLARDHYATEQHIRVTGIPCTFLRMNLYIDFLPNMVGRDGVIRGPADDGRVSAILRDDVADCAAAVLTSEGHDEQTYELTGREAITLTEAAALMSRITGKAIAFHDETVEAAYASRAVYDAPAFEVDGWVTTYTTIAAGEGSAITDSVLRLTGHEPATLEEYLQTHPECLDQVVTG
jgi:NAD(P)H dehydrogenase (quinone)